jgi:hypothetical protein
MYIRGCTATASVVQAHVVLDHSDSGLQRAAADCNNKVEFGVTGKQGSGMLAQIDSQALLTYDNLTGAGYYSDMVRTVTHHNPTSVHTMHFPSLIGKSRPKRGVDSL